ncbi:MAG: hypothetical protein AB2L07_14545 [Thermoanaerobaculaceae bacterium]
MLTPAADAGDEAVEELAGQAVARLSGERPARGAAGLPGIVAFDAGPVSAARHEHLGAQVRQLGLPAVPTVTALATSAFHGHLGAVTVTFDAPRRSAELEAALRRRPQVQLVRPGKLGMVSAVVGGEHVRCGEIAGGEGCWNLLLAYDGGQLVGPAAVGRPARRASQRLELDLGPFDQVAGRHRGEPPHRAFGWVGRATNVIEAAARPRLGRDEGHVEPQPPRPRAGRSSATRHPPAGRTRGR